MSPLAVSLTLHNFPIDTRMRPGSGRLQALGNRSPHMLARVEEFIDLSKRGLPRMYREGGFVHTVRAVQPVVDERPARWRMRLEGDNLRYTTKVALGLSLVEADVQREILGGDLAADLALRTVARAEKIFDDPGVLALAAWAAAEAAGHHADHLFTRLGILLASESPIATVDCAWTLIAALAAAHLADTSEIASAAKRKLLVGQGPSGLFPHMLPAASSGRLRAHVGSFADQVYSIQGLARASVAHDDVAALAAANACAEKLCALQGPAGQWWWHYDARAGSVVEGYPVYSVHQHGMGPMALLDLREAGGHDRLRNVISGLAWFERHPEISTSVVCEDENVIWRKVGRREPRKAVRTISALTTAARAGTHLPGLDALFPPNRLDRECRPYELGWLLYAWLADGVVEKLRPAARHARTE